MLFGWYVTIQRVLDYFFLNIKSTLIIIFYTLVSKDYLPKSFIFLRTIWRIEKIILKYYGNVKKNCLKL